jgi:ribosomal protein S18 acetylase RimI-like enzyme
MGTEALIVRRAERRDLPALGALGARLVRGHYAFDPKRFMTPGDQLDDGYSRFLGSQLRNRDAAVFVAEWEGRVAGYVYTAIAPLSWEELRDEAGFIHDVIVDETLSRHGIGGHLAEAAIAWCRERGMPRVLLHTAEQNISAQHLFTKLGFRRTMIEMTLEL